MSLYFCVNGYRPARTDWCVRRARSPGLWRASRDEGGMGQSEWRRGL